MSEYTPNKSHVLGRQRMTQIVTETCFTGPFGHPYFHTLHPDPLPNLPPSFRYPIHIFLLSIIPNSLWVFSDDYICSCNSQTFQTGIVRVQTIGDRRSVDGISSSVGDPPPPPVMRQRGSTMAGYAPLRNSSLLYLQSDAYSSHRYTCF